MNRQGDLNKRTLKFYHNLPKISEKYIWGANEWIICLDWYFENRKAKKHVFVKENLKRKTNLKPTFNAIFPWPIAIYQFSYILKHKLATDYQNCEKATDYQNCEKGGHIYMMIDDRCDRWNGIRFRLSMFWVYIHFNNNYKNA